jgi:hypothetical protein
MRRATTIPLLWVVIEGQSKRSQRKVVTCEAVYEYVVPKVPILGVSAVLYHFRT